MTESVTKMPVTYATGWLYVLRNERMPTLLKIGFTTRTIEQRIAELSGQTGVPVPFTCIYRFQVKHPQQLEQSIHGILEPKRVGKEFFEASAVEAVIVIRQTASSLGAVIRDEWIDPEV